MPSERDRLLADALHEVAVASQAVGEMIHDLIAIAAVEQPFGGGHAHVIAEALAERPRRGLDAGSVAIFRMARRTRAKLTEALKLIELHLGIANEIEQRIEQHRAVPGGEHEAVAVWPVGVARIELQEACE